MGFPDLDLSLFEFDFLSESTVTEDNFEILNEECNQKTDSLNHDPLDDKIDLPEYHPNKKYDLEFFDVLVKN
jgi:hypothetical protein